MKLAIVLNVHGNPDIVTDTADAIRTFATPNIVINVDGLGWGAFENYSFPGARLIRGYEHGANRSPYKNVAKGLLEAYDQWPDCDWYGAVEYDVLFVSSDFKDDLIAATDANLYAVGIEHNYVHTSTNAWILKEIFSQDFQGRHKFIGCFMFFSRKCMEAWKEAKFLEELLRQTEHYKGANFPNFSDYAVEEVLFPTAASLFGKIGNIRDVRHPVGWRYLVRFAPNIAPEEVRPETSIVHPTKNFTDPIRSHFGEYRRLLRESGLC